MEKDVRFSPYFLFTQYSLATFDKCPLKFKKRYIENLKWEGFPDEMIRRQLENGRDFHLLSYRYFSGVDTEVDEKSDLGIWMKKLKEYFKIEKDKIYLPEYKIRMAEDEMRLEANFDLLIVDNGHIHIYDWKTHSDKKTRNPKKEAERLNNSLQTMVYMYVLGENSQIITGEKIPLSNIKMSYWQPEEPNIITTINYNEQKHLKFKYTLEDKIKYIMGYDYSNFDKNQHINYCKYCEFNWLCNGQKVDFNTIREHDDFLDELEWDSIKERF